VGLDEAVETITVFLLVVGALPFVLARLERTLDKPAKPARRQSTQRAEPVSPQQRPE
jgi:hypothetical protein